MKCISKQYNVKKHWWMRKLPYLQTYNVTWGGKIFCLILVLWINLPFDDWLIWMCLRTICVRVVRYIGISLDGVRNGSLSFWLSLKLIGDRFPKVLVRRRNLRCGLGDFSRLTSQSVVVDLPCNCPGILLQILFDLEVFVDDVGFNTLCFFLNVTVSKNDFWFSVI